MIDAMQKQSLAEFTRSEFIEFLRRIERAEAPSEEENNAWVRHFKALVSPHPHSSDLIFWPEPGADNSPEGITAEVERYCREHGLPCFNDSAP